MCLTFQKAMPFKQKKDCSLKFKKKTLPHRVYAKAVNVIRTITNDH